MEREISFFGSPSLLHFQLAPRKVPQYSKSVNFCNTMVGTAASKSRVIFDPIVKLAETLSIYDYTPSEIHASWFSDNEMDKMTEKCFKIIIAMESREGSSTGSHTYCTRGLEGHSTLGRIGRKRNRSDSIAAVLEEQERQWDESEEMDFQAISDTYGKIASSCQRWAQVMGNRDAKAAESYLSEDEDEYARLCRTKAMYAHKSSSTESAPLKSSLRGKSCDVIVSKKINRSKSLVDNLANLPPRKNARFFSPQARKSFTGAPTIKLGKGIRDRLLPLAIAR